MKAYYKEGICYVCQQKLTYTHSFYKELCPECGDYNFAKRNQSYDLSGYNALVTGGRIKIGFETSLKLLRAGANVIITSRFPNDTFNRYSQTNDFNLWKDNIHVIGADFRHINSVVSLIEKIRNEFPDINIVINNAAQTVRRPPLFYKHLIQTERESASTKSNPQISDVISNMKSLVKSNVDFLLSKRMEITSSADLSQIPLLPDDYTEDYLIFPKGLYDKDGQQVDLRAKNSWMLKLDEVDLIELYEVLNVNLIAPFLFNAKLKPLMSNRDLPSFIINVTAMEGNFYSPKKNHRHPHTNMAKAALNMMTRSSASEYSENNIFMNSVDTGWITNEKPNLKEASDIERKSIMAIDETDGAARILDPIFSSLINKQFIFGKLFKNYYEYNW